MRTEEEIEYLLKSIDASNRKFIIITPEFRVVATNRYTRELYDRNIIGLLCYQIFYNNSSPCEDCPAVKVLQDSKPILRYIQNTNKKQEWTSCRYSYPIFKDGTIETIVLLDFDRPSTEEVEEELKRSNAFLRNLILSSVDGILAADKTGKVLIYNDAAVEITGYSIDEALDNLNIRDVYPGNGAREIMKKLRSDDYGGKGKLKSYQVDVLRKDGKTIPINLNAAILYEDDKEVATIGFFHDLSEELMIKSELEKTQVQLLQAEKMSSLGKLAAGVAHQLNNPLGGITLYGKLILEEYNLEEDLKKDMINILQDAKRCKDTVKELLEFARQSNRFIQPHDINDAISRTLFLLENQALFHDIEIKKDLADNLPLVSADIQQLNHMFMNIILNAAQAMEGKGNLTLKTYVPLQKDRVCIEISDTGPGIPEDISQQIFDPFFTTKDEGKGTGLGLSIVYGIVKNHGGKITVNSILGKGATFIIELPITTSNDEGVKIEE